ncbi:hypothetical protein JKG68_07540 [Microvirga aerilata]|uniref:HAD family hydrolase n=1 Tax=Microvirga aerilata TaxID=670292 RepID=A0A936Z7D5_9HYPH|nr:hypothetical protein [Microvirga aerilata]MBL0403811.1 hypothetical protein [Microvirga aerilata]
MNRPLTAKNNARVLGKYGVTPDEFLMVGNSVRTDMLPVIAFDGRAVHVPCDTIWEHEHVERPPHRAGTVGRLFDLLKSEPTPDEGDQT